MCLSLPAMLTRAVIDAAIDSSSQPARDLPPLAAAQVQEPLLRPNCKTTYSQYSCSAERLLSRPKIKQKNPRPGRISSNKSGPSARTARGDRFRSRKQEDRPLKTRRPAPPGAGAARARAREELKKRAQGAQRVNALLAKSAKKSVSENAVEAAPASAEPTSNHVQERRRTAVARPA